MVKPMTDLEIVRQASSDVCMDIMSRSVPSQHNSDIHEEIARVAKQVAYEAFQMMQTQIVSYVELRDSEIADKDPLEQTVYEASMDRDGGLKE